MSLPEHATSDSSHSSDSLHGGEVHVDPHSDFMDSLGWMALGVAVLVASILMDRLEQQHVNPYTVPGLLPGLLGIAMIVLGGLLALRSWRRGGVKRPPSHRSAEVRAQRRRLWMVIALCMTFDVALVGHGLPFWLAGWIFVTTSILLLQHATRKAAGQKLTARVLLKAGAIGLGAGLAITLVFQEIFLVHLP